MKFKLIIITLALVALTACGGSSSSDTKQPESPDPIVNKAPIASADVALAQNNETITIDVLANDTDPEGKSLSLSAIASQPVSGKVEIVDNQLVYTPEDNVATIESITYEVSDGEMKSSADVEITVNHTMTISGLVTDSPIRHAIVVVRIGDNEYSAEADANGNYSLPVTINDMSALIYIHAKGNSENNQENVELIAIVGQADSVLDSTDENRALTNKDNNKTNVTHVSTATYLLVKDRTETGEITGEDEFNDLVDLISTEDILETAGFIKLLVDDPDFEIPEGETILSTLDTFSSAGVDIVTTDAINEYLITNSHLDLSGQPTDDYLAALEDAVADTVKDPNIIEQFTAEDIEDKNLISLFGAKQGWNEYSGSGLSFSKEGTGVSYSAVSGYPIKSNFTWSVDQGSINVSYQDGFSVEQLLIDYPYNTLRAEYGFTQELVDELVAAHQLGLISDFLELDLTRGIQSETYTLLANTPANYQVSVSEISFMELEVIQGLELSPANRRITNQSASEKMLVHTTESAFSNMTLDDIEGEWVLSLEAQLMDYWNGWLINEVVSDYVIIGDGFANARIANKEFSASLVDGTLILIDDNVTYKFTPFNSSGKGYLAKIEKWVNGNLELFHAKQIAKVDDSYKLFIDDLVTELPHAQIAYINGSISERWNGDKLKLSEVFGYVFNHDGSLNRGISGVEAEDDWGEKGNGIGYFNVGDDRWTWTVSDNQILLKLETEQYTRVRTWDVVSVDDEGRAIILERSTRTEDFNNDGEIKMNEVRSFIHPRINIIKLEDLSQWEAEWQNTIDIGLFTPSS